MGVESDFDRLSFLNEEEFAVEVTLYPNSDPRPINAVYDSGHIEIANGVSVISTAQPSLTTRTKDVNDVEQGDEILIEGRLHTVTDIQPDGTGMTMLMVHKA